MPQRSPDGLHGVCQPGCCGVACRERAELLTSHRCPPRADPEDPGGVLQALQMLHASSSTDGGALGSARFPHSILQLYKWSLCPMPVPGATSSFSEILALLGHSKLNTGWLAALARNEEGEGHPRLQDQEVI